MKLYHSSTVKVESPDLDHSRDYLDFGKGFYLTSLREQAVLYAERFLLRERPAVMNVYDIKDEFGYLNWNLLFSYLSPVMMLASLGKNLLRSQYARIPTAIINEISAM